MRYVHGIREYVRGGVCVVDEFVLAYPDHFNPFTPIIQPLPFDFLQNNDFVYKTYPPLGTTYPHN